MQPKKSTCFSALFLLVSLCVSLTSAATTYYLSSSLGNDSNSGTDPSSAWQSLDRLNSYNGFRSGDNILFKRGDTFYGGITVSSSGLTFGAYGSGNDPEITGFTTVTSWNNLGGNIWESSNSVSSLSSCNVLLVSGVNTPMGRYPNNSYMTYQSFSGNTSITSNSLSGTDWTGAVAVIKKERYVIDKNPITSQSGNTLYYSKGGSNATAGWGFFIQNDSRTLDQQNEWYYNPSNGKLRIYSSTTPKNVQLATIDNLIYSVSRNNTTIENLSFSGANNAAFYIGSSSDMEIKNCSINYCYNGLLGVNYGSSSNNLRFENSTINHSNNNGISLTSEFNNALISNNKIQNSGVVLGMFGSGGGTSQGIDISAPNSTVINNEVDNSGYIGIGFNGSYITIKNNFVNTFCTLKDDGGGIYTGNNASGNEISGNIVINGIGNGDGTLNSSVLRAHGIFLDDNATGVKVLNNSVANIAYAGIFLHNAQGITITGNTTYNANIGLLVSNDNSISTSDLTVQNNVLVGISSGEMFTPQNQISLQFATIHNNLSSFGNVDNNYYARPINDKNTLVGTLTGIADNIFGLSGWQNFTGFDTHSSKSPKAIDNANDMRFEYNASASDKTVSLGATYIDIAGKTYNGSISLAPYSSAVLIKNGASTDNQAPTADAGSDQSVTLPTNEITLTGTGKDADGTISSYNWSQVSGPSSANFTSPGSASTNVNQLVEGTYVLELKVTDNQGAAATSTVQIKVVNSAGATTTNVPPTVSAGGNGTINLPNNSVFLTGTATDADGTISSYNWSQVSGPSSANFTSPGTAGTDVNQLVQGTYVFELKATDNQGATTTSTVQINVVDPTGKASSNIAPVADAGGNGTVTLPNNSVFLTGTGSDTDGTISSYEWSQVSGPAEGNITNPNSAPTSVTGLTEGTYVFELKVTDNEGATGTSTVQINVVNSTASTSNNITPIADAGGNGTITLPTNIVFLTGTGSDADGTISAYHWTQISGPAQGNITSPDSAPTTVTGLVEGTYVFQFMVTDNDGGTATSTVQINVVNPTNSVANFVTKNIAPIADAGGNGTITLPTNTVFLTGTGSDADGTISAYHWSQISGPAAGNITSPNSASTTVTGLIEGTYVFQFMVTDNQGATATSTVKINVVSATQAFRLIQNPVDSSALNTTGSESTTSGQSYQQVGLQSQLTTANKVKVFPNPFTTSFNVLISGDAGKYEIILMDESGKVLLVKSGIKSVGDLQLYINGSKYNKGILLLKVVQNGMASTTKIIKQ
jgi:parallel beta-helix repeat protein